MTRSVSVEERHTTMGDADTHLEKDEDRGKPSAAWRNDNLRRRPLLSAGRVGRDGRDVTS